MLEIRNITKEYRPKKGKAVVALKNVSLKFPEKGMVFILGKSGSGKSTLLNLMGGLDKYDSGEIIIKGKSSKNFTQSDFDSYRNTYVGFIFQEYNILNEFNVAANIALALQLQGRKATDEAVNKILDDVDLSGYGARKPTELSGGQKQRVAIARALVKNPEIIMADEPTGALDSNTGLQVFDTLKKLSKDKLVIVITHDRDFAEMYGDRVIELKDGEILSDIEKYSAEPTAYSEGVSVIDEKIIQVKKGYRLTAADFELINKYLEKNDAIISVDDKSNSDMKRFARIGENGSKESFRDTDENKIKLSKEKSFKLIKSRLPFKSSLKIGASSLKSKPIRLIMTIFLSLVAFTMFGLADTMASYNKNTATYNSLKDSNIQGLSFEKIQEIKYDTYTYMSPIKMDDNDIALLNEKTGFEFRPVYKPNASLSISGNLIDTTHMQYIITDFGGLLESDSEYISSLGYSITGTMPSTFKEIAISKFFYETFKKSGYRSFNSSNKLNSDEITSESVFLAAKPTLTIGIDNSEYRITAIIDTQFDASKYPILDSHTDMDLFDYITYTELTSAVNYGYHGMVFVKEGYIKSIVDTNNKDTVGIDLSAYGGNLSLSKYSNNNSFYFSANRLYATKDVANTFSYMYFDGRKTSLNDDEVLVSSGALLEMITMSQFTDPALNEFNEMYFRLKSDPTTDAQTFIPEHIEDMISKGVAPAELTLENLNSYTDSQLYYMFELYIMTNRQEYADYRLASQADEMLAYAENSGLLELMTSGKFSFNLSINNMYYSNELKLAGVYHDKDISSFIVSDYLYRQAEAMANGIYAFAITKTPDNNGLRTAIDLNYAAPEDGMAFNIRNGIMTTISMLNSLIESLAEIFLYIGLGFALFAALMLTNFISTSISYKKREIGILRAVGAKSADVYGIFCNESLIIALINFVLSTMATIITVIIINSTLRNNYNLNITVLNIGIRQIALMFGICVGVALIASFIPTYRISRKKPVDAIRG